MVKWSMSMKTSWWCYWCRYQDDVDPSLSSRNTLGNGKKTANSKSQRKCQMVVAECIGGFVVSNAEVVVVVDYEATVPK